MKPMFLRSFKAALICMAGAALLAVLNIPAINSAVKNLAYSAFAPLQKNVWNAGAQVSEFLAPLANAGALAVQNAALRAQVADLLVKTARVAELEKENGFLRQGLNLGLDEDFDLKLADIVAKNAGADILTINKGSRDMVETGMSVITQQKELVGKISRVYPDFSEIKLVTSKDISFDVRIGSDVDGLAKGIGGYQAVIDLVPKDKEIKPGDAVYTNTLGGIFPGGLLVGTVKDVKKNDVETFQSAALIPAFNVLQARQVFVVSVRSPLELKNIQADEK